LVCDCIAIALLCWDHCIGTPPPPPASLSQLSAPLLPAAACFCLLLPAAACCCLLLPAAACCCLLLPAAAGCCLPAAAFLLQPARFLATGTFLHDSRKLQLLLPGHRNVPADSQTTSPM
jgi:hypothetical protein